MHENYVQAYYDAITKKQVIVGKWIRKLYKKIATGIKDGTYNYDGEKADKAIKFIEDFCHHSEGRNDLLKLELWQKALVACIFGVINPTTGNRQFKEVFLLVARKNGKTLLAAAIMAYMAFVDGEYGAKCYCLAPKLEQAELCYESFYQIVKSDDELDMISKRRRSDIYIECYNTSVKKIAFNSKKSDGFNPSFVLCDEMEAWPGEAGLRQYNVMISAFGARKQPLMMSTSTAGYENDGIFDELVRRATAWLNDASDETMLLPFLYMIDDPEQWYTKEELMKSNPNMDVSVSWDNFYVEEIKKAKESSIHKTEFMTKYCNIKQNRSIAWLEYQDVASMILLDKNEKPVALKLEDFKKCYCVGGIDLSRVVDLTAACIVIERNDITYIFEQFFMPLARFYKAIEEEKVPYEIYRQNGILRISGENQVDYKDVLNWFQDLVKIYKIYPLKVGYDRYSAQYLVQDMKQAGFHMDDVYQGTNLTPILHQFEGDVKDRRYCIGNNYLTQQHLLNVAVDLNINDSRMKPVKIDQYSHIDGAVAIFDALAVKSKFHNEIGKQLKNIGK